VLVDDDEVVGGPTLWVDTMRNTVLFERPTDDTVAEPVGSRPAGGRPSRRTTLAAIAAIVVAFAATFVLLLGQPVQRSDEVWFLWVMHRITHGAVLYRGAYFVSAPLPAWLGALAVLIGGTNLLAVRFLSVAIFVASGALAWIIARRSGLGWLGRAVLVAALFVYASPVAHFASVYSALAILFALVAFWAGLAWLDERSHSGSTARRGRWLWVAGVAVGLAIASKPNTGALSFAALAVTLVYARSSWRAALRDVGRVLVGAAAVVVAVLLPVLLTGGLHAFIGDVVLEKGSYLRVMGSTPFPGFSNAFSILPGHVHVAPVRPHTLPPPPTPIGTRYFDTFRLVPFLALAIFGWAAWRTPKVFRADVVLCIGFGVAAFLAALPSAGPQHLTEVMPLLLAAVAGAVGFAHRERAPGTVGKVLTTGAVAVLAVWLAFGVAAIGARAIEGIAGDDGTAAALPHLGGAPELASDARITRHDVAELRRLTGGDVFIVRADAAYFYLAGGLRNPTPYDFPVLTDFGRAGERGIVSLVARQKVPFACVAASDGTAPVDTPDFRPLLLNHAIRHDMRFVARLAICNLYAAR
jgi:4-amino-4-deoxy-L-arabinose transferase-like glycosyltransferase